MPPKPIRHDPGEWVARFVGDRGPVRIGSQAGVAAIFDPDPQDFANPGSESAAARRAALAAAPPARPRKSRALGVAVFGLVAAAAVVAVAIVIVRGAHPGGPQGVQTAVATTHVAAPPRAATSSSAPVVRQAATPEKPGVEATPGAEQAISSKSGRYSIEVGSFATLEAAIAERDRASQATGIQGWVVPAPEGSSEQHRVILGIYRSKERAAAAAKMVVATRTLPHAVAVALPPKHARL